MKIKIFIPLFLALWAFLGCSKLKEDPKATLTPATYFQTQQDLDASVTAIYQQLVEDGAYAFDFHLYSYFGSDDLTADPNLSKGDQRYVGGCSYAWPRPASSGSIGHRGDSLVAPTCPEGERG